MVKPAGGPKNEAGIILLFKGLPADLEMTFNFQDFALHQGYPLRQNERCHVARNMFIQPIAHRFEIFRIRIVRPVLTDS